VTVQGVGNVRLLPRPRLENSSEFDVSDPAVSENVSVANNLVGGSKTFQFVMLPKEAGQFDVGRIRYPVFDPNQGAYRVLEAGPFPITVTGAGTGTAEAPARFTLGSGASGIHYLKTDPGHWQEAVRAGGIGGAAWMGLALPWGQRWWPSASDGDGTSWRLTWPTPARTVRSGAPTNCSSRRKRRSGAAIQSRVSAWSMRLSSAISVTGPTSTAGP